MADTKKIRSRKIRNGINDKPVLNSKKVESKNTEKVENRNTDLSKKKVKTRKVRMSFSKAEEQKLDKAMEREDKVSIAVMVIILSICFIVGICLGYILYRIAINGGF